MSVPTFQREGARIGGLTQTTIAMVARTDSAGVNLYCDVYSDIAMSRLVTSSAASSLTSDNNYTATAYVTGLTENKKYYWRARADDGAGNSINGSAATYSTGSFRTPKTIENEWRFGIGTCDPMGPSGGWDAERSPRMWQRMRKLKLDQFIMIGDIYYSDINTNNATADYTAGAWRNPATDADATVAAYRTNCITTFSEMQRRGIENFAALFRNHTPSAFMWDDHDRGWNDMDGSATWSADKITRAARAQQAGHEMFMDLNASYIVADGRPWEHGTTQADYYHIDINPVRVVVLNCRAFRDARTTTDSASKSMLGATQKAWLKDKIINNPCQYLVIANPIQMDGYHGWNESTNDGWVAYSYERDELLDYIRANGNPARTVIVSGDTHAGSVEVYRDASGDIWEFLSGDFWPTSGHGYINGWKSGSTGKGGELIKMRVNEPNFCLLSVGKRGLTVSLVETVTGRAAFTKTF